jgi:hypothetical protein
LGGEREGAEWVVRDGVGPWREMNQSLYAHMNNKRKMKKKKRGNSKEKNHHSAVIKLNH